MVVNQGQFLREAQQEVHDPHIEHHCWERAKTHLLDELTSQQPRPKQQAWRMPRVRGSESTCFHRSQLHANGP